MKTTTIASLSALTFVLVASAQDASDPTDRLVVFERVQALCKVRVLADSELAKNFVIATERSLSDVCECAAVLVVSSTPDKSIAVVIAGDRVVSAQVASEVPERFNQCIAIH
jgi:hypothetical protein